MAEVTKAAFTQYYGAHPAILVAAPGRVNLIGEHIDYEGYGVLPMALQQSSYIAAGPSTTLSVSIRSSSPYQYPAAVIPIDEVQETLQQQPHSWHKYVLAAVQDVLVLMAQRQLPLPTTGIELLVHGTIPPGGGLSSSSALVVAAAVAALTLWNVPADRMEIASLAARCERHVGTQGGGMDQAISLLAQPGVAMKVDFNPVRAVPVKLPQGASFVVGHCLSSSFKADTAASRYNRRVVECRLAAMLLAKQLQPNSDLWRSVTTLQQVQDLLLMRPGPNGAGGGTPAAQESTGQELTAAVESGELQGRLQQLLPQAAYTIPQLEGLLGEQLEVLLADSPSAIQVLQLEAAESESAAAGSRQSTQAEGNMAMPALSSSAGAAPLIPTPPPPPAAAAAAEEKCGGVAGAGLAGSGFLLQQRARHVFTEAARVLLFQQVCADDSRCLPDAQLQELGSLMSASHASCRDDYQCSCRELDDLVAAALAGGACGARLTGAGWGGCMVALVPQSQREQLLQHLTASFYMPARRTLEDILSGRYLFATEPGGGAGVEVLQGCTAWVAPWAHM